MATTSDVKNGMYLDQDNDTYVIIEFQHVKPGKGNAFVRIKMKSLTNGRVIENTVVAGHKLPEVQVERRQYQYLYTEGDNLCLMHQDTFEQIEVPVKKVENPQFLKEGMIVDVAFHSAKEIPLACSLPPSVTLQITYMEPGAKGNTATNTLTPAKVETGAEVRVPMFIKEGDFVKIDTTTGAYLERVNMKK